MVNLIKFYNLSKQDGTLSKKIFSSIKKIIKNKNFINGKEIELFEKKFAFYVKSKYSVSCSNGTDALTIALKSLKLKPQSEVIIPAMTYISTAYAVINANLKPLLVDVDYNTGLMDINDLRDKITKNTKIIMPVHLYGNVFEVKKIKKIKKKIIIIDDASQAHGASYLNKKMVGTQTNATCFSLYPGKNLGAYGDAGIITTDSHKMKNNLIKLSNLGNDRFDKYNHQIIAHNNRLDTIQAGILNIKLSKLNKNNSLRQKIANKYINKIKNKKIKILNYSRNSVFHQFIILTLNRKQFMKYMDKNKIQTGIHYPKAIHEHQALKKMFKNQKFPNASRLAKECVSIPIDPYLKKKEVDYIIKIINSY